MSGSSTPRWRLDLSGTWPLASTAGRIRILLIVFAVLFSLAGVRAIQLQVIEAPGKRAEALDALSLKREITPLRGQILDKDGQVLAFTRATVMLTVSPSLIAGRGTDVDKATEADRKAGAEIPQQIAPALAACTGLPEDQVLAKLTEKDAAGKFKAYVRIARQQSIEVYNCFQADKRVYDPQRKIRLGWTLNKEPDPTRVYPMGTVAPTVVGYLGEGKGVAGLEASQNTLLSGRPGQETYENSRNGKIPLGDHTLVPAVDGTSVNTTIDSPLCYQSQQLLDQAREQHKQDWGFVVITEIKTGKVRCLANTPSFNGNEVGKASPEELGNPAMVSPYQPGSTLKLLTLATVLDAGAAGPDTVTRVASSKEGLKTGDHTIHDSEKHDAIGYTTRGILVTSSNQGVIQLMRSAFKDKGPAGRRQYVDYLTAFGLGKKTDIGIPGENPGVLPAEEMLADSYTIDSVAFGTSLTVNAVQMAAAVGAVANDGVYVAPSLIAGTTAPGGEFTPAPEPATHRVIKPQTSADVLGMMENRVLHSYSTIGIPGIRTGAKTGTAWQGPNMISSIVGVAPADDPQYLVYSVFYQRNSHAGSGITIAGPLYQDVMSLTLQRYGVLPSADAAQHCTLQPLDNKSSTKKVC